MANDEIVENQVKHNDLFLLIKLSNFLTEQSLLNLYIILLSQETLKKKKEVKTEKTKAEFHNTRNTLFIYKRSRSEAGSRVFNLIMYFASTSDS